MLTQLGKQSKDSGLSEKVVVCARCLCMASATIYGSGVNLLQTLDWSRVRLYALTAKHVIQYVSKVAGHEKSSTGKANKSLHTS